MLSDMKEIRSKVRERKTKEWPIYTVLWKIPEEREKEKGSAVGRAEGLREEGL